MVLDEMSAMYNPWSLLQQPLHASRSAHPTFRSLLAAADQGWQVEEPVTVIPVPGIDAWNYSFVLYHPARKQACWLIVPALPEVERYVEKTRLQVIEDSIYGYRWRSNENIGE